MVRLDARATAGVGRIYVPRRGSLSAARQPPRMYVRRALWCALWLALATRARGDSFDVFMTVTAPAPMPDLVTSSDFQASLQITETALVLQVPPTVTPRVGAKAALGGAPM